MKTILTCFLCVAAVLAAPAHSHADVISLRADIWDPYNGEPNSEKPGFMIEIAEKIFTAAGHTLDYQILPWSRAVEEATQGRIHGIIGAYQSDAPNFVFPDQGLGFSRTAFFVRDQSDWTYEGIESMENIALGAITDYAYDDALDSYIEAHKGNSKKVQLVSGDNALELNVRKLLRNRIDVIVEDPLVMQAYLQANNIEGIKQAGALEGSEVYIAFSPDQPQSARYAAILSQGITDLRASGEFSAILAKYGVKDWRE